MSDQQPTPATINGPGWSATRRRSRRIRWCEDHREGCPRKVDRGDLYVRAVIFPNHDVATRDRPSVMVVCMVCAAQSEVSPLTCLCPPCPGRGNDGHGLTHCAECCFGTGVEADPDCPVHGRKTSR